MLYVGKVVYRYQYGPSPLLRYKRKCILLISGAELVLLKVPSSLSHLSQAVLASKEEERAASILGTWPLDMVGGRHQGTGGGVLFSGSVGAGGHGRAQDSAASTLAGRHGV